MPLMTSRRLTRVPGYAALILLVALTAACGTTTPLQSRDGSDEPLVLTQYKRIVIGPFTDEATAVRTFKSSEQEERFSRTVADAGERFRSMLADEFNQTEHYDSVRLGDTPEPGELYVDGDITNFRVGNKAARFLVGLGAGKVAFDAVARVQDGASRTVLGTIVVDRHSFPVGGMLSLPQTVEGFMRSGARRVAEQVAPPEDDRLETASATGAQDD